MTLKPEIKYGLLYLLAGILWLLFSDLVIQDLFPAASGKRLQTEKDIAFVVAGTVLGYFLIKFARKKLPAEQNNLEQQLLHLINENGNYQVCLVDAQTLRIAMANHYFFGKEEELKGHSPENYFQRLHGTSDNIAELMALLRKCKTEKQEYTREIKLGSEQERYLEFSFIPVNGPDPAISHVLTITRDITETRLLQLRNQQLNVILETGDVGIWNWEVEKDLMTSNAFMVKSLGYDPAKLTLNVREWSTLIHPDDKEYVTKAFYDHLENKKPYYKVQYRLKAYDESWKWFFVYAKVIERNEAGQPLRMLGVVFDIDRMKMDEQVIVQQSALLKEYAFSNSHRVRAPLARIIGLCRLLSESAGSGSIDASEVIFSVDKLVEASNELDEVIAEIAAKLSH